MEHHLFDSELRLMELLWAREPVSAKALTLAAAEALGWNKNTTYTVLKKLVDKGVVRRDEPNFICTSLVKRPEVQRAETRSLIDKLYHGSRKAFFAAFLEDEALSAEELAELRDLIDKR
ncbi:MAG: BlaI/MecI/CopY family transcriptional regulator [Oscillospiraceae bacterium]|nr:BlaI/MecI/CopY family transcriptional regulator [Oscillospiraceae bacterium]